MSEKKRAAASTSIGEIHLPCFVHAWKTKPLFYRLKIHTAPFVFLPHTIYIKLQLLIRQKNSKSISTLREYAFSPSSSLSSWTYSNVQEILHDHLKCLGRIWTCLIVELFRTHILVQRIMGEEFPIQTLCLYSFFPGSRKWLTI